MSKHLETVERKNVRLTGRNIQRKMAQGGAAICYNQVGIKEVDRTTDT